MTVATATGGVRAAVFLGDLLHALQDLQVGDTATAAAVVRMLSLESWQDIVVDDPVSPPAPAPEPPPQPPGAASMPSAASSEPPAPGTQDAPVPTVLSRLPGQRRHAAPDWAAQTPALPRAVRATSPPPEPLFEPRQERALVSALAASRADDGDVHIERLLDELARGGLPRRLPQRSAWSTRAGLQLLVDDGPGMAPFRRDVEHLWTWLGQILPDERLARMGFDGCPVRGCRVPRRKGRHPWAPPAPGGAVLVVTDLGIAPAEPSGGAATLGEWLRFCAQAEAAAVQVRTLVPYPAHRWPAALASLLHPVAWDRPTTANAVRQSVAASLLTRTE